MTQKIKGEKKHFVYCNRGSIPRTSSLTTLCLTYCFNLSFCLFLLLCLYLSSFLFLNFCFVPRQLYSLLIIIVCSLSVFSDAFCCFSVSFSLICRLSYNMFIKNICLPKVTVFYCLIDLCFVKWVSALNC